MTDKEKQNARARILKAAITLFSLKGFAGVGVRQIAEKASVNSSMISYYFNGKTGIIKTILNIFFTELFAVFDIIKESKESPQERVYDFVRRMIELTRQQTELVMVCYNELPLDIPEVNDLKTEQSRLLTNMVLGLFKELGINPEDKVKIGMIGPSLLSIIFSHFRMQSILNRSFDLDLNDEFYEQYAETVATLFLNGIHGITNGVEHE